MERPKFLGGAENHSVPPISGVQQNADIEAQFFKNHVQIGRRELDTDTRIMLIAEQLRLIFSRCAIVS